MYSVKFEFLKLLVMHFIKFPYLITYEIKGFEGPNIFDRPGVAGAVIQKPL